MQIAKEDPALSGSGLELGFATERVHFPYPVTQVPWRPSVVYVFFYL